MLEMLSQVTFGEGAAAAGGGAAVALAVVGLSRVVANRGFRGSIEVGKHDARAGRTEYVTRSECSIMHAGLERLETDRHNMVMAAISEVKQSITRLHERIDSGLKGTRDVD